jgi:hypothetical protein
MDSNPRDIKHSAAPVVGQFDVVAVALRRHLARFTRRYKTKLAHYRRPRMPSLVPRYRRK